MEKFTDPNAIPKEMEFYTLDEFKTFISYESDLFYKIAFEVLYFCELRFGELRGLTWDNIDFEEKTLSVKKNVVNVNGKILVTSSKSKKSIQTIPITDTLLEDLKLLKIKCKECYGFNDRYYVFGDVNPLNRD